MGQNKVVRKLNRELRQTYLDNGIEPTHKYCSVCNELKILDDFCKSNVGPKIFGVESKCRMCNIKHHKKFMEIPENKEHRYKYEKEYRKENKNEINHKRKAYKKNNPEKVKKQNKETYQRNKKKKNGYVKEMYATDEDFRTKKLMRSRLWNVMNGKKNKKSCEYGIDWKACIDNLGPRPDNINDYHIDHIIPCAAFDFTNPSHPAICFHPTNLRWVLADENLSKNDTIYPELVEQCNLGWIIETLNIDIDDWNSNL
jgi:hypothetical protein